MMSRPVFGGFDVHPWNEATRVHRGTGWRCGMAAGGAGTAAWEDLSGGFARRWCCDWCNRPEPPGACGRRPGDFRQVGRMIERAASGLEIKVHPHMLRHACGFKLANDGVDTRAQCVATPSWRQGGSRVLAGLGGTMNRRFGYPQLIVALIIGLVLGIAATRFLTPQHHRDRETFEECLVHEMQGLSPVMLETVIGICRKRHPEVPAPAETTKP
jgi:hypothetical protein